MKLINLLICFLEIAALAESLQSRRRGSGADGSIRNKSRRRASEGEGGEIVDVNCTVIEIVTSTTPKLQPSVDIDSLVCAKENGFVYDVQMDDEVIDGLDIAVNSGSIGLNIQNAVVQQHNGYSSISLGAEGTTYTVSYDLLGEREEGRRNLIGGRALTRAQWLGQRSLAAFRVIASDAEPSVSMDDISDALFGTFGHKVTLRSRYEDCSFGKFSFVPAQGLDLRNGVQEIHIDVVSKGQDRYKLQNAATDELIRRYGSTLAEEFDHVTYILPSGTFRNGNERWYAYGYVNAYLSVFNDEEITYVSTAVHEIGHNLGLQHSNFQGRPYRDTSGYMGLSYANTNGPLMCFNAAKSWSIGWFDDKKVDIDPTKMKAPWKGELVAFVDYPKADPAIGQYVLIKVGTYYFIYNRAKGLNSGTQKFHNKISIAQALNVHDDESEAEKPLRAKSKFTINDFNGKGVKVVVQVCELKSQDGVDYAGISVYLSTHGSACGTVNQPTPIYHSSPSPPTRFKFWEETKGAQLMQSLDGARGTPDESPAAAPSELPDEESPGQEAPKENVATAPLQSSGLLDCMEGQFQFSLSLKTDAKPDETSWKLYRLHDLRSIVQSPTYDEEFHHYNYTTCLQGSSTYGFRLFDSAQDGISSDVFGSGHFTLFVDGVEFMSGGEFQTVVEVFLTGPCPDGTTGVKVLVVSDSASGETTWSLQSVGESSSSSVDLAGGPYGSNVVQSAHACVPKSECYRFVMSDSEKNGFLPGEGSYEVEFDGSVERFSNFTSTESEETLFGDCADFQDDA